MTESQALVHELEKDPRAENQRVEAYSALAVVQHENGDQRAALESPHKAVSLAESLVAHDPASVRFRTTLAIALQRLAYMWPDEDEYLAAARRSSEICQELCIQLPEGDLQNWTRLIGENNFNTGSLYFNKGRLDHATESMLAGANRFFFQTVLDRGDHSPEMLNRLAKTHLYLCRLYSNRKQFDEAMASGRESIEMFRTLVANHPDHLDYGMQLNLADQEIGLMCIGFEKWDLAIKSFESARKTVLEIAARQGSSVSRRARIQVALAAVDQNLVECYDSDPARYAAARRALTREAYEICEKISLVQPLTWNLQIISAHQSFEMVEYQDEEGGEARAQVAREVRTAHGGCFPTVPVESRRTGFPGHRPAQTCRTSRSAWPKRRGGALARPIVGHGSRSSGSVLRNRLELCETGARRSGARCQPGLTLTSFREAAAGDSWPTRSRCCAKRSSPTASRTPKRSATRAGVRSASIGSRFPCGFWLISGFRWTRLLGREASR